MMKIEIIQPVGYCSGVSNAISKAIAIKKESGDKPVYILGSLVHNSHVIDSLESIGIINLSDSSTTLEDKINSLEDGSIVIFTAHGHDEKVDLLAKEKHMVVYDCVCPNVKSNMTNIKEKISSGYDVIFVGINNHPETVASLSISEKIHLYDAKSDNFIPFETNKPVFVTNQTTLNFKELETIFNKIKFNYPNAEINPLGDWTGGTDVDTGATNRKLGSDMADSVTGGGLHGKDLSKADVSVNIYAWCKAQASGQTVQLSCAIGDELVDGKPYSEIVAFAQNFIKNVGGFEKFAEWGLF